ncbi:MAG TPA: hypothetical protein VGC71_09285 [Gaiellales bacterium]
MALVFCAACGRASSKGQFNDYIKSMAPIQARFLTAQKLALHALDEARTALETGGDSAAAVRDLKTARDQLNQLAATAKNITPPSPLKTGHARFVQSIQLGGQATANAATAMADPDPSQRLQNMQAAQTEAALFRTMRYTLGSSWRTAVVAEANWYGVTLPAWAKKVGTR